MQSSQRVCASILALLCAACGPPPTANERPGWPRDPNSDPATLTSSARETDPAPLWVGTGIYDITGPAAEIGMMGYAHISQCTSGIHMRLWARAFVVADPHTGARVAMVIADLGQVFHAVKQAVIARLASSPELASFYRDRNTLLAATHTHSGPGGYSHYLLYNFTTLGFIEQNFEAIADGIFNAIRLAHRNLKPARIYVSEGELEEAGWQRSPQAYLNNPATERLEYPGDTDKTMTLLKFVAVDGTDLGTLNWFAVHPTSLGPTNTLISGDHKGYASYQFEHAFGADRPARRTFVAAFAQGNAGDVSPNIPWGPAGGPDDVEHMELLGNRQLHKALELYHDASEELVGGVDFRHSYVDFGNLRLRHEDEHSCQAALGLSFSAGSSEDNKSPAPLFPEGITHEETDWSDNLMTAMLSRLFPAVLGVLWPKSLDPAYKACHAEKPILVPAGVASMSLKGTPLAPAIMPLQLIRIGSLAIAAVPAEVTTMAGRRLRSDLGRQLEGLGVKRVVIAALANGYASYVTTREEYAVQHYEGASTQFGPHTLAAYQQEFARLAQAMISGSEPASASPPPDLSDEQHTLRPGVVFDAAPLGKSFGEVDKQPQRSYAVGDRVEAVFWGGHPRNNLRTQDTFLTIERRSACFGNGLCASSLERNTDWAVCARDWDPETTYQWQRHGLAASKVTIAWDTRNADPGEYRIRHCGDRRSAWPPFKTMTYCGATRPFRLEGR